MDLVVSLTMPRDVFALVARLRPGRDRHREMVCALRKVGPDPTPEPAPVSDVRSFHNKSLCPCYCDLGVMHFLIQIN
jgi:hypothetical protein